MVSYAAPERSLAAAIADLHDPLWTRAHTDERELLSRILRGARGLDRRLGTRGRLERAIRPMIRRFRKVPQGEDLFTFLQAVAGLSYAAARVRSNPREAAKGASELAVSLSLHQASAAGASDLIEGFEAACEDFAGFSVKLEDVLEERGVLRAGDFRRATNQAFDAHAAWDGKATTEAKRIVAAVSVASAGFACAVFVEALRALGRYRETPYSRLVPVVAAILESLGGQP